MQPNEYQKLAEVTENKDFFGISQRYMDEEIIRLNHAQQGLITEVGEFTDALKRYMHYASNLDGTNMVEELGDILWYVALAANALGFDLGDIMEKNIAKLRARYPEKFKEFDATNRDLVKERQVLEGKCSSSKIKSTTKKSSRGQKRKA
jgi:NTP pyrophosphatase (non-canonical NTP hydrolase)